MAFDGDAFTNLQQERIYEKNPYTCEKVNEMVMVMTPVQVPGMVPSSLKKFIRGV